MTSRERYDPRKTRRELLPGTLEHAANIPYYRDRWSERAKRARSVEELSELPFLHKDDAIAHQDDLLADRSAAYVGIVSSGTMHGERAPLRVLRTTAETEVTAKTYPYIFDETQGTKSERAKAARVPGPGLTLRVVATHHGLPAAAASPGQLRMPWTYTANAFRLFQDLVSRPQPNGQRVVVLNVGAGAISPLTAWMLENGIRPSQFDVRIIGTYSYRLSPRWRKVIEDSWDADVLDNFSLSEFGTSALECRQCGYSHWLWPPVLPEVLDPATKEPIETGTGVLVLTSLAPHFRTMPLIRYWTGDLVEIGPFCERANDHGIQPRGRLGQSVLQEGAPPGAPLLLSALDVQELLDGWPEVARHQHPCEQLGLMKSVDVGSPKYELLEAGSVGNVATARIEVRFDPRVFADRATELRERFARALAPRREDGRPQGTLHVEIVGPGSITSKWSKF